GNGMPETYKTQEQWLNAVQLNGCGNCHQLGDKATREIPAALGTFDKSIDAWQRRVLSGPAATSMAQFSALMDTGHGGPHSAARRVDRSHQGGRASCVNATAAARSREESRGHGVRLAVA